ncbi:MAG: hypothetical protein SFV21_00605 [Rhodospirillaceae bacterium]|nr:hypothetical protein [Rhodospirillaceae bacterium]
MTDIFPWLAAPAFTLIGLSQIYVWPRWLAYYAVLAARGSSAIRVHGLAVGALGAAVVVVHNVWSGPATVLTLAGWLMLAEGALCLAAPRLGLTAMVASDGTMRRRTVIATGALSLVVAGVLWAHLLPPLFAGPAAG